MSAKSDRRRSIAVLGVSAEVEAAIHSEDESFYGGDEACADISSSSSSGSESDDPHAKNVYHALGSS